MSSTYLDHHATTPCDPRVVEAMLPFFTEHFGNAGSLTHAHGRKASNAVEEARVAVARFFGVLPPEILFTAGATESNNIALAFLGSGDHVISAKGEHKSVLAPLERLERAGVEVTLLTPDREGRISADGVAKAIRPHTRLVSVEAANGEIGTIQPLGAISAVCRARGVLLHSDVTQAAGKIPLDFRDLDLASFSGHKIYGPKGIGGLFVRRGIRAVPVIVGGGQERGIRSGTVNVPGAVGLAMALRIRGDEMESEAQRLAVLRDELRDRLLESIPDASVNGPRELRLPGNLNVSFGRVEAESLLLAMKRFSLSTGSACSSGQRGPSHVLKAIGLSDELALGSIRIGLGRANTLEIVGPLVDDLERAVRRLREISPP
ncbi:MAG: cysteine desulfurase family protein [Thermoanaerobaculia bacterium]